MIKPLLLLKQLKKIMKSYQIIDQKLVDPNFQPKPYTHGDWFISKLLSMGFGWEDNETPHFKVRSGDILVIISPFPNVVVVDKYERSFTYEIYCHDTIPQNEEEFNEFWNQIKSKI